MALEWFLSAKAVSAKLYSLPHNPDLMMWMKEAWETSILSFSQNVLYLFQNQLNPFPNDKF